MIALTPSPRRRSKKLDIRRDELDDVAEDLALCCEDGCGGPGG